MASRNDYPGWGAAGEQVPFELHGVHKTLLECLACFQLYRGFGFPADEIYFQVGGKLPIGWQVCLVVLKKSGRKFTFIAGAWDQHPEAIEIAWTALAERLPTLKPETLDAVVNGSTVRKELVHFVLALQNKGFRVQESS